MNEIIVQMRIYLKLNRTEFAERVGVTPQRISNIENGKCNVSYKLIRKYCQKLNLPEDEWL